MVSLIISTILELSLRWSFHNGVAHTGNCNVTCHTKTVRSSQLLDVSFRFQRKGIWETNRTFENRLLLQDTLHLERQGTHLFQCLNYQTHARWHNGVALHAAFAICYTACVSITMLVIFVSPLMMVHGWRIVISRTVMGFSRNPNMLVIGNVWKTMFRGSRSLLEDFTWCTAYVIWNGLMLVLFSWHVFNNPIYFLFTWKNI